MQAQTQQEQTGGFINNWPLFIVFLMVFFMVTSFSRCHRVQEERNEYKANTEALQNQLQITKDKAGRETARRLSLEASNKDFIKQLAEAGGEIERLQKEVAKAKNTQAVAIVETKTKTEVRIKTVIKYDTVEAEIFPIYTGRDSSQFGSVEIYAARDSIRGQYINYETGVFRQVNEKAGIFKPKRPVVYYTSTNPNTRIIGVSSYAVKPPPGRFWTFLKGTAAGAAIIGIITAIK